MNKFHKPISQTKDTLKRGKCLQPYLVHSSTALAQNMHMLLKVGDWCFSNLSEVVFIGKR